MQNIVVVSIDTEWTYRTANRIAKIMGFQCLDAESMLKERIIKIVDYPINFADDLMRNIESNLLKELSLLDKSVIAISDDMFLSNTKMINFENSLKICVKTHQNNEILARIQELLEKKCDITLVETDLEPDKLIKILTTDE